MGRLNFKMLNYTYFLAMAIAFLGCKDVAQSKKKASKYSDAIGAQKVGPMDPCLRLSGDDHEHGGHDDKDRHDDQNNYNEEGHIGNSGNADCTKNPTSAPGQSNFPSAGINFSVTIESCSAQGRVWLPFGGPGKAAICGNQSLANFCCSMQNVASVYDQVPANITSGVQTLVGQGYKLYNCSSSPTRNELHLVRVNGNQVSYRGFWFTGVKAVSSRASDSSCQNLTMKDLGLDRFMQTEKHDDDHYDDEHHDDDHHDDDHHDHDDEHHDDKDAVEHGHDDDDHGDEEEKHDHD